LIPDQTNVQEVTNMTFARLVNVKFRPGKREEGVSVIADFSKDVREGFEGMLILFPTDDPDKATYITLWDSEETMNGSWKEISPRVTEALKDLLAEQPEMRSNKVREMQRLAIPA
jgi:heme-degrading monooxygenase HmoA